MTSDVDQRASYPYFLALQTRWMDNDLYGHVNKETWSNSSIEFGTEQP